MLPALVALEVTPLAQHGTLTALGSKSTVLGFIKRKLDFGLEDIC
jgi:hypothetical protein